MNDDLHRDETDAELARHLRALGGEADAGGRGDTRAVLHAMGPRFASARRRRRAAIAASAAMAVVSVAGVAAALSGGSPRQVETLPGNGASSTAPSGPTATDGAGNPIPGTTSPEVNGGTAAPTTDDGSTDGGSTGTPGTGATATTQASSDTTAASDTTAGGPDGSTSTTADVTTTTSGGGAVTKTCTDAAGNSITVRWNGTALSLISAAAATGWTRNFDDDFSTDEIRIEFESATLGNRIRGRWHNGALECSVSTFTP